MKLIKIICKEEGFTLLEVVISLFIFLLLANLLVQPFFPFSLYQGKERALLLAQAKMEEIKHYPREQLAAQANQISKTEIKEDKINFIQTVLIEPEQQDNSLWQVWVKINWQVNSGPGKKENLSVALVSLRAGGEQEW